MMLQPMSEPMVQDSASAAPGRGAAPAVLIGIGALLTALGALFCLVLGWLFLSIGGLDGRNAVEAIAALACLGIAPILAGGGLGIAGWRLGQRSP
jgi:hypothetical protein